MEQSAQARRHLRQQLNPYPEEHSVRTQFNVSKLGVVAPECEVHVVFDMRPALASIHMERRCVGAHSVPSLGA